MRRLWQTEQDKLQAEREEAPKSEAKPQKVSKVTEMAAPRNLEQPTMSEPVARTTLSVDAESRRTSPPRSFVGTAMCISGELESGEDLLIAGRLEGSVSLPEHCLTVISGGYVEASISANSVVIEGEIRGDIDCKDSVVLKPTARVNGNIKMRRINIMDGAVFNGKVTMRSPED